MSNWSYRQPSVATVSFGQSSESAIKSWQLISSTCLSRIEPVDRRRVESAEDSQAFSAAFQVWKQSSSISKRVSLSVLDYLRDQLLDFENYIKEIFQNQVEISCLRGMVLVALQVAGNAVEFLPSPADSRQQSERQDVLLRLGEMLASTAGKLQILVIVGVVNTRVQQTSLVGVYELLLQFLEYAILSVRRGVSDDLAVGSWPEVETRYTKAMSKFDEIFNAFKQLRELQSAISENQNAVQHNILTSQISTEPSPVVNPHTVVLPAQNVRFYGRCDVLEQIATELKPFDTFSSLRTTILYGLGGVGKTEIARAFAYKIEPYCDAVFWIQSESSMALQESFTDAAIRLDLPGSNPSEHRKNGLLMMNWLCSTSQKWLLIFNNVDNASLLKAHWPSVGRGSILVTTRNPQPFYNFSRSWIKVLPFSSEEGTKCLLSLVTEGDESTSQEKAAAKTLNDKLGGHALGISQIAALIRFRHLSMRAGAELYQNHQRRLHTLRVHQDDLGQDLTTVWLLQFGNLQPTAKILLGILMFLSPDAITDALFNVGTRDTDPLIPDALEFYTDPLLFVEAEGELLELALVQKTTGTREISLHRLVQVEFEYFISTSERQSAFEYATILLCRAFPKQIKGRAMFDVWDECQLYASHVINLSQHYMRTYRDLVMLQPIFEFCEVLSNCAWYLRERGAAELDDLLSAGFDACERLKHLNGIELIYAHMCNTASAWDDDRGYFQRAEPRFLECLAIRRKYLDKNDDEISGALHNISLNYLHSMKFAECLDYRQQSLDIIARMPGSTVRDLKAAKRKYTLGQCQTFQGDFVEARVTLNAVLKDLKTLKITGSWFMISLTYSALGCIDFTEGQYESSEVLFEYAKQTAIEVGKRDKDLMIAGCLYYLGNTALKRGHTKRAIKLLLEALDIFNLTATVEIERARALFMVSKALKILRPSDDEFRAIDSNEILQEALDILRHRCPSLDLSNGLNENMFRGLIHEARV